MAMALVRPKVLIRNFLQERSILYGVVPFLIATTIYEFAYVREYRSGRRQSGSPFSQILPIPAERYYLYQTAFAPIVNVVDVLIFGGVVAALARLLSVRRLSFKCMLAFFLLIGNTWTLVALVVDNLPGLLKSSYSPFTWGLIHPISALVVIAYMIAFIQKQTKISFWKAAALVIPSVIGYLAFRVVFFR